MSEFLQPPSKEVSEQEQQIAADELSSLVGLREPNPGFYINDVIHEPVAQFEPFERNEWTIAVSRPQHLAAPSKRKQQPRFVLAISKPQTQQDTIALVMRDGRILDPETFEVVSVEDMSNITDALIN